MKVRPYNNSCAAARNVMGALRQKRMATYMFEIYYAAPANHDKESRITAHVTNFGGRLDYREEPDTPERAICLTYEFDNFEQAQLSADGLRQQGEHVEGPSLYSD